MLKSSYIAPDLFSQPPFENRKDSVYAENVLEFENDCERILNTLMSGERKTYSDMGVNSRRMTNLKRQGYKFSFTKVKRGNKTHFEWYCSDSDIENNLKIKQGD